MYRQQRDSRADGAALQEPHRSATDPRTGASSAEKGDVLLYKVTDAMRLLSMSRSVIYEQMRRGRLRSVQQGRARLIPASAIRRYVELLISEAQDA